MGANNTKKRFRIIGYGSLVVLLILCGVGVHEKDKISSNRSQIRTEKLSIKRYHHNRDDFTENKLERSYDNNEPDLGKILDSNRSKVKRGMRLAFSRIHSQADYRHQSGTVKKLLGSAVSNKVLSIVKPQNSEQSSTPRSVSNNMTNCTVSYGQFDNDGDTVPIVIVVSFDTPKINPMAGAGASNKNAYKVYSGQMVIDGSLNVQSGSITVNHEHDQVNNR